MGAVQSAETGSGKGRYISGDVCAGSPGNYPKGNLLYSVHGESLKSSLLLFVSTEGQFVQAAVWCWRTY